MSLGRIRARLAFYRQSLPKNKEESDAQLLNLLELIVEKFGVESNAIEKRMVQLFKDMQLEAVNLRDHILHLNYMRDCDREEIKILLANQKRPKKKK